MLRIEKTISALDNGQIMDGGGAISAIGLGLFIIAILLVVVRVSGQNNNEIYWGFGIGIVGGLVLARAERLYHLTQNHSTRSMVQLS